jgi:hypothetical protein
VNAAWVLEYHKKDPVWGLFFYSGEGLLLGRRIADRLAHVFGPIHIGADHFADDIRALGLALLQGVGQFLRVALAGFSGFLHPGGLFGHVVLDAFGAAEVPHAFYALLHGVLGHFGLFVGAGAPGICQDAAERLHGFGGVFAVAGERGEIHHLLHVFGDGLGVKHFGHVGVEHGDCFLFDRFILIGWYDCSKLDGVGKCFVAMHKNILRPLVAAVG